MHLHNAFLYNRLKAGALCGGLEGAMAVKEVPTKSQQQETPNDAANDAANGAAGLLSLECRAWAVSRRVSR